MSELATTAVKKDIVEHLIETHDLKKDKLCLWYFAGQRRPPGTI